MKLFVWDLHGVLEQGNDRAAIDVSNRVLEMFGHAEHFTYEDGVKLYGRKWYEYFEWILPSARHEYCLTLQNACFTLSETDLEMQRQWLRPTEHSLEVLSTIAAKHHQILISNTRGGNLEMFLKTLGLDRFFSITSTALAVDGHSQDAKLSKSDLLRGYLAGGPESYEEIVVIGDSPSDMGLADVAGGVRYLFTHPEFPFRDCVADYRIRDLRDILRRL